MSTTSKLDYFQGFLTIIFYIRIYRPTLFAEQQSFHTAIKGEALKQSNQRIYKSKSFR